LVSASGGGTGKVWLRESPDGVVIFARFSGDSPKYARFRAEMNSKAHVGFWLAASPTVELPPLQ
jgi:hypothetical protein